MKKLAATCAALALSATAAFAEGQTHHVAIHVNQNDPAVLNMALNNAQNVSNYYTAQGDKVVIEMVAYGPGLNMLIPGQSPVEDRVKAMALELEDISFAACANTLEGMQKKAGHDIALMSEATVVPSGVVRLIELQQQGYAYVRP
ncbi:DsrE family protein [Ostreiculturibacter nitratireducens]|uniref:DsrE family protein n=1 Tax=Ostreiculturibacter nitratireducens TaxID=3075226 RepID=UPI0031B5CE0B